jgi:hypothetical protein
MSPAIDFLVKPRRIPSIIEEANIILTDNEPETITEFQHCVKALGKKVTSFQMKVFMTFEGQVRLQ